MRKTRVARPSQTEPRARLSNKKLVGRRSAEPSKAARRFRRLDRVSPCRRDPRRHFGLALPGLARKILPARAAAASRVGICERRVQFGRDQRLVLFTQLPSSYERWYAEQLYVSGYTDAALDWWAARIERSRRVTQPYNATLAGTSRRDVRGRRSAASLPRDVFVYFDNDAKVHAPFDAIQLAKRLRVGWSPAARD